MRVLCSPGVGIACLPDFAIRDLLADGRLIPVLADHVRRSGAFHVLWPASKHPSPKVRAFADVLCARVFPDDQLKRRKQVKR